MLIIPAVEGVSSLVLHNCWVSARHLASVVCALVSVVRAWLVALVRRDRRLAQLKLWLVAAVLHNVPLDSFHLSSVAGRILVLICHSHVALKATTVD